jgi:hypothetical protein
MGEIDRQHISAVAKLAGAEIGLARGRVAPRRPNWKCCRRLTPCTRYW